LLALVSLTVHFRSTAADKLRPEYIANLLPQILEIHLKQHEMDVPFMRRLLKEFVEELDPSKSFLLKPEAEALTNLKDDELSDLALKVRFDGDFSHFRTLLQKYIDTQIARDADVYAKLGDRAQEIKDKAKQRDEIFKARRAAKTTDTPKTDTPKTDPPKDPAVPTPPTPGDPKIKKDDTDADEEEKDPDGIVWKQRPTTNEEREKRLIIGAGALYTMYKSYLNEEQAMKQAIQGMQRERNVWLNLKEKESERRAKGEMTRDEKVYKMFLKSFMMALDPHSDYLEGEDEDEFTTHMERSFFGIGVQIRPCPLGAYVEEVIKGGPSDKSKRFGKGDQIIAVDDVVLAGKTINEIVKLIKGEKGTEVKLRLLKKQTPDKDAQDVESVTLRRDTIELADMRVKGKKYDTANGPVGVIYVNAFYNGVHKDVRDRINELSKEKPLTGVVLDLRWNTGGYLEEAIGLAGLFVDSGWVVGERDARNKVIWQDTPNPRAEFKMPLVVLVNQFSASASEIVTGTLKAYGRAVVVAHTQTFGKGTVQKVLPLGSQRLPGEIKITTDQYFLANGSSVQLKGIDPDVVIPGPKLVVDDGYLERATPNAIEWNKIPGKLEVTRPDVKSWMEWRNENLPRLQEKSNARVAANPELRDAFDPKKRKNKEDAATPPDQQPDKNEDAKDSKDAKDPKDKEKEKDVQAEEAVAIVNDMIPTWSTLGKVVETNKVQEK
jgi:carboxyl-terminal processing protease